PLLERHCQVNPVPFSSRKLTHLFFLVGSRKVKLAHICSGIYLFSTQVDQFISARNIFPYRLFRIKLIMLLIHVGNFYCFPYFKSAVIGLFLLCNKVEEGCFSSTIRAYHAYNSSLWKSKIEVFKQ